MEFEFTRNTLMGEYYVKCSMGHEIIGRWLQEEIGTNRQKIDQVCALLDEAQLRTSKEQKLLGTEISLVICEDEVTVQENSLDHDAELEEQHSEYDYYNCESTASCGLEDFELLIERWKDFIGYV
ncbi:YacL family protein [Vibrio clamense]|uniref:YacL family protein n=1 Tax=Vibrio TaxID=662 RepID=UPI000DEBA547|nr:MULTISPECIES: YacL family protein [Vibrio]MDN3699014.1 YacL family protein [Vibrio cortegadensis]NOH82911.1 UPF0231 family protein [Vibrio sp. 03-59-1]RBW64293.1 hypothetical protein DS893_16115 [Vibrionales bacterium C3R12]TKF20662.1 UPF0231 family protein [Vibrio genomosp. F6]